MRPLAGQTPHQRVLIRGGRVVVELAEIHVGRAPDRFARTFHDVGGLGKLVGTEDLEAGQDHRFLRCNAVAHPFQVRFALEDAGMDEGLRRSGAVDGREQTEQRDGKTVFCEREFHRLGFGSAEIQMACPPPAPSPTCAGG